MNDEQSPQPGLSIPWFGARKLARKLVAERDAARQQLARIGAMGRELVAEVQELRAQREIAFIRFKEIGALPHLQLEFRRRELEREIAEQEGRLEREKAEAAAALETARRQLKEAHK